MNERKRILITISIVVILCVYALFLQAYKVDNWRGFWFSLSHVLIVAAGTAVALRSS